MMTRALYCTRWSRDVVITAFKSKQLAVELLCGIVTWFAGCCRCCCCCFLSKISTRHLLRQLWCVLYYIVNNDNEIDNKWTNESRFLSLFCLIVFFFSQNFFDRWDFLLHLAHRFICFLAHRKFSLQIWVERHFLVCLSTDIHNSTELIRLQ